MKNILLLLFALSSVGLLVAQPKGDYTWVLGYDPNDSVTGFGGTLMKFNTSPVTLEFFNVPFDVENSAQICGEEGNTLFYCNGCQVINSNNQLMHNGDDINPGEIHNKDCNTADNHAYGFVHQGLLALPWPEHSNKFFMFHLAWYRLPVWPKTKYLRDFYYSIIDMNSENGLGAVEEKNHLILQDTNLIDNLTAVRHGNGRDWWIILPRGQSDLIYTFLLTPKGLQGPFEQHIGQATTVRGFVAGQIVFSPDGTKFVRVNRADGIDIFNFDRCSGVFSCDRRLPFPYTEFFYPSGASISPNSRYLYVSTTIEMYQYDLWAKDINSSKVLLGVYDGFIGDYDQVSFYQQRLAPDGKIYMSATNAARYLHVVHHPDSAGLACDFRQHDLKLPTHNAFCLPNFPYFRLYDAPFSPCDTLGIDAPEEDRELWYPTESLRIIPNPASDGLVTVRFAPCSGGLLRICDVSGRQLLAWAVGQEGEYVFDCSDWPVGVYLVSFIPNGSHCKPYSAKLVVAR